MNSSDDGGKAQLQPCSPGCLADGRVWAATLWNGGGPRFARALRHARCKHLRVTPLASNLRLASAKAAASEIRGLQDQEKDPSFRTGLFLGSGGRTRTSDLLVM